MATGDNGHYHLLAVWAVVVEGNNEHERVTTRLLQTVDYLVSWVTEVDWEDHQKLQMLHVILVLVVQVSGFIC